MDQETETKPNTVRKGRSKSSEAIAQGVADGKQAAAVAVPAVSDYLAKSLYGACYYAAYGVTFGALMIGKLIPSESAVARGLHDGVETATREFKVQEEQRARRAAAESGTGAGVPVRVEGSAGQPSG